MSYNLKTLGQFSIDQVLDMHAEWEMGAADKKATFCIENLAYEVNRSSQRYGVFSASILCFACGLVGEYFLLQQSPNDSPKKAHFNLYGKLFDEEILFTKDHIMPKSKGGSDNILNYRTMCLRCNMAKADNELLVTPLDILSARQVKEQLKLAGIARTNTSYNKMSNQLDWLVDQVNKIRDIK